MPTVHCSKINTCTIDTPHKLAYYHDSQSEGLLVLVFTYCCVAPDFKDGADTSVRLKQEKLPPLLPTDLNIAIFVHPGKQEGKEERERVLISIIAMHSTQWQILRITGSMYFYECVTVVTKAVVAMATIFFPQYWQALIQVVSKI